MVTLKDEDYEVEVGSCTLAGGSLSSGRFLYNDEQALKRFIAFINK